LTGASLQEVRSDLWKNRAHESDSESLCQRYIILHILNMICIWRQSHPFASLSEVYMYIEKSAAGSTRYLESRNQRMQNTFKHLNHSVLVNMHTYIEQYIYIYMTSRCFHLWFIKTHLWGFCLCEASISKSMMGGFIWNHGLQTSNLAENCWKERVWNLQ